MNEKIIEVDNKFYKECEVVMLASKDNSAPVDDNYIDNKLSCNEPSQFVKYSPQHLYILSDEEIKEGDWYIVLHSKEIKQAIADKSDFTKEYTKKIISTSDESLHIPFVTPGNEDLDIYEYEILPRPSNDFIKKYCELGGIDKVLVEYEELPNWGKEEITILKLAPDNTITIKPIQQKESYSKEEVVKILHDYQEYYGVKRKPFNDLLHKQVDDWIKENLK